ncbi:MAG: hypothetical protein LBV04_08805 [Deferribacteraceae bacterium]|jgi:nicotinamidase-related amidase|nr:hypothetical protein [Deferribacteraceae bacterium]
MATKTLLIIDPQNDFVLPDGALSVAGAVEDMQRLIPLLDDYDKIVLTLDSHAVGHIATPVYWHDANGNQPQPFTLISYEDVANGHWMTDDKNAAGYLKELESRGKKHTIWPEHCVYGTFGWQPYAPLKAAIDKWLYFGGKKLAVHLKGRDKSTEMFSAVLPVVASSAQNKYDAHRFLDLLQGDSIAVAGEADNICVRETVADIIRYAPELAAKLQILRGCMSIIPMDDGIEEFWESTKAKGVSII